MVNLGRIEGGSVFACTVWSTENINRRFILPENKKPLVGDSIIFNNGELRSIIAVDGEEITCGEVIADFRGKDGVYLMKVFKGQPVVSGEVTKTPITFQYSNGRTDVFDIEAQNGSGEGGGKSYTHALFFYADVSAPGIVSQVLVASATISLPTKEPVTLESFRAMLEAAGDAVYLPASGMVQILPESAGGDVSKSTVIPVMFVTASGVMFVPTVVNGELMTQITYEEYGVTLTDSVM